MKKTTTGLLALLIFALVSTAIPVLAEKSSDETPNYKIYYTDSSETSLVSRDYRPEENTPGALVQDMVNRLNSGEAGSNQKRLFPDGVQIRNFALLDGALTLSFAETYKEVGLGREILMRDGIVKSFVQFPDINTVEIRVGDAPLKDSKGVEIGPLSTEQFVELASDPKDAYRYDKFLLYFTDKDGKKLLPETRTIYYKRSIPKARVALEQLIKGPMEKEHYPTLPDSVQVRSITLADQVCYADVSSVFTEYALSLPDEVVLSSVANTLIANTDAEKVQISVNGEDNATFGEDVDLYHFFQWNDELLEGAAE